MACIKKRRGKWVVDYRDSDGRRHWETKLSKKTAQDRPAQILSSDQPEQPIETPSFQEYGDWWLENVAKGAVKASTLQEYTSALEKHVYPSLGTVRFIEVKRPMVRELIAIKKKEGLAQSTIRNIAAPVRGMYNQAIEDGITEKNPAARIGKLNKQSKDNPKKKIDPLTREEVAVLLEAAREGKHSHCYPLLLCACRSGLRMGELISLMGIDIDFKGGFVHVQRNLSRGKISATKNGEDRRVDMSTMLANALDELLSSRRAEGLRDEMKKPAEERRDAATVVNAVMDNWLFQTPGVVKKNGEVIRATRFEPSSLRKAFNRILVDAGLRRIRFHDLRHTFASLLLQNGESLTYVKDQMGHSSIQVTVDIYGHLVPGGNRAAVDKLDIEIATTRTEPKQHETAATNLEW
jgi:integrase